MAAALTDLVRKSTPNFSTTLNGAIASGDTSITLTSATGLSTATAVTLVIDATDPTTGASTPTLKEVITGTVSGSVVTTDSTRRGLDGTTAQSHASGANVVMWITANLWNDFATAFLVTHGQDGTQGASSVPETALSLTDITTSNASTSKHGLAPKLPNDATRYLDGTGAFSTPSSNTSPWTRLIGASGTHSTNAATNVSTVAISGLTEKDTLKIFISFSAVTQNLAGSNLYSTTDSAAVAYLYQGGATVVAGQDYSGEINIRQNQTSATKYIGASNDGVSTTSGGATSGALLNSSFNMSTAWTGSWTLALRLGATTGTAPWSWEVFKIAGQ